MKVPVKLPNNFSTRFPTSSPAHKMHNLLDLWKANNIKSRVKNLSYFKLIFYHSLFDAMRENGAILMKHM